jgi:spore coat polysaccharide biosynthesis predicted glycosyltransferase SpsG
VAAADRKADLLIVDYIYVDNEVAKYFKERAKTQEVFEEEIEHRALNPKLLIVA